VGDGPQREFLTQEAKRLGIESGVTFTGWLEPHTEIRKHLEQADIFVFPSVREFGGGAVLEAMAAGVPPIVVDYGGPAEIVTPATGWALPIGSRTEIVQALTALLDALFTRPQEIVAKSIAAQRRCFAQFTWEAKARRVVDIYSWVLHRTAKPLFPMPIPDLPAEPPASNGALPDLCAQSTAGVSSLSK
jgi:glycosyltransferase involved in cell wall biosynthesis